MNNRHIQTFLTVSAAFFAMNAPLHANASARTPANATFRTAQHVLATGAEACAQPAEGSAHDA